MNPDSSGRRVQRVRHELRRRDVQVARVEPVGTQFVRITFAGEALADFVSDSFDDHVKLMFTAPDGEGVRRDYTPRSFDRERRELAIEFALHGHGPASAWARRAEPGQAVVIGGPRGSMIVPLDYDWHLLAGDASALPAIARRLEELPPGSRAIVLLQLDEAERREFKCAAALELHWAPSPAQWLGALRGLPLPAGSGYAWCAGEATLMARARDILLGEKGHPHEDAKVAAYWRLGTADFHETLGT